MVRSIKQEKLCLPFSCVHYTDQKLIKNLFILVYFAYVSGEHVFQNFKNRIPRIFPPRFFLAGALQLEIIIITSDKTTEILNEAVLFFKATLPANVSW